MAQLPENPEQVTVASGETDIYPTVWTFERVEEVRVAVAIHAAADFIDQQRGVHYEVAAGDWLSGGADIVFLPDHRPPAGARVLRQRLSPVRQDEAFGDLEAFRPLQSERAYDRLTRIGQENRAAATRAVSTPPGEEGVVLPAAVRRRSTIPVFDDAGGLTVVPAVEVLNEIGMTFEDDGAWGAASDPITHDDGAFA